MALRATLALFAAAVTLIVAGPLALAFTDAALTGRAVTFAALLGTNAQGPIALLALVFLMAVLGAAIGLVLLWLPVHALLDAGGLTGWGMYVAAGYVMGGALAGAILGPWGASVFPLVTLLVGGATAGGATALVFWLIRRPDWT